MKTFTLTEYELREILGEAFEAGQIYEQEADGFGSSESDKEETIKNILILKLP